MYVSLDKKQHEFEEHYAQMPWLAVPFVDQDRLADLKRRFRVVGIPHLPILKSEDGLLVTPNGRKDIHERGVKTIPDWNKTVILNKERELHRIQEEKDLQALNEKLTLIQLEKTRALQAQAL